MLFTVKLITMKLAYVKGQKAQDKLTSKDESEVDHDGVEEISGGVKKVGSCTES